MKQLICVTASLTLAMHAVHAQEATPATSKPTVQLATHESAAHANDGLSDLTAMTFDCPKAALNAAAREAAQVPSQGTYQFSYFKIINDAHHAAYEVRFKSNYEGELDLDYCVMMYCQQGWDAKAAKPEITLLPNVDQAKRSKHTTHCGAHAPSRKH